MAELFFFLLSVVLISLSGVMAPGPVFAVTVAKGHRSGVAGFWIGLGHGLVEIPLMTAIYLGLGGLLASGGFQRGVALGGGLVLLYLGWQMVREREKLATERDLPYSSVTAGVLTTALNPYFLLWWATIGAALISRSLKFGLLGFLALAVSHLSCDILWELFVSKTVHRTRSFWSMRLHRWLFIGAGLMLVGFGGVFLWGALRP